MSACALEASLSRDDIFKPFKILPVSDTKHVSNAAGLRASVQVFRDATSDDDFKRMQNDFSEAKTALKEITKSLAKSTADLKWALKTAKAEQDKKEKKQKRAKAKEEAKEAASTAAKSVDSAKCRTSRCSCSQSCRS